mmetsp:Transcript_7550/g.11294  ORF Transcript_7550/g.11294 Transcript_7550/m.11294 type:complete len:191 (+) Transcript_7550:55-627(+)
MGSSESTLHALADVQPLDQSSILKVLDDFNQKRKLSENSGFDISKIILCEALEDAGFRAGEIEMLSSIYVLFDVQGKESVPYNLLLSGISPLTSTSTQEILSFALKMFDAEDKGVVTHDDLNAVLRSINEITSFFGDSCLLSEEIDEICNDIFSDDKESIAVDKIPSDVLNHHLAIKFISGNGEQKYNLT